MIWDEVVNVMDLELNPIQLQNWIVPLKPIRLQDGVLILDATSRFIYEMIHKKYQKNIEFCLSQICRTPIVVDLIEPSQPDYHFKVKNCDLEPNGQIRWDEGKSEIKDVQNTDFFHIPTHHTEEREYSSRSEPENSPHSLNTIANELENKHRLRENNGYYTLNPKYTIENFVRGESNNFAYAVAQAVVKNPGVIYNPLFIYGQSGLGKTHLMQAIAHSVLEKDPTKRILYITSENFTNEMIGMIENGGNAEKEKFRQKYRSIDMLLIDDIQFIAGKKATQEEIFHTFNDLREANKHIILSSDKPPKELKNLEGRLVTRFDGGMIVDIQKPDFETRVAILSNKMKGEVVQLPRYVLELIASHSTDSIRELEGSLMRVLGFCTFKEIDPKAADRETLLKLTRDALKLEKDKRPALTIDDILQQVSAYYQLEKKSLLSKTRQNSIAFPRQVAMYLSREMTKQSYVAIGSAFGRDHSTVVHACDKIKDMMAKDTQVQNDVETLLLELRGEEN